MLFVIFGITTKPATTESGEFFCPQCGGQRPYQLRVVRRYGTLYFIPLLPLGEKGEYVECGDCQGTFVTAVLDYDPEATEREFEAEVHKGIRAVMLHMMLADGEIHADEIRATRDIYLELTGAEFDEEMIRSEANSLGWRGERELIEQLSSLSSGLNDHGKELVVKAGFFIAGADGQLADDEAALLFRIGDALDMSAAHVKAVMEALTLGEGKGH